MKRSRPLFLVIALLFCLAPPAAAQTPEPVFFAETGCSLSGDFLAFYQKTRDAAFLFGLPISDAIQNPLTGQLVQYFQNVRFELHPNAAAGQRVYLSSLGEWFYEPAETTPPPQPPASDCRFFPKSGKSVCYSFLDFYEENNGEQVFGEPFSDLEIRQGIFVQYFEKARFEWRPAYPPGERVVLTDLGRIFYEATRGPLPVSVTAKNAKGPLPFILRLFVDHPLLTLSGNQRTQTAYLVAQDRTLNPISGVQSSLIVTYTQNKQETYALPPTDAGGIAKFSFNVPNLPIQDIITLEAIAQFQGAEMRANHFFRIWW